MVTAVRNQSQQAPLIAHIIYRLGVGGLENGLIDLINQMPVDNYRHMIICLKGSTQFSKRLKREDVQIIDLKKKEGQDWRSFVKVYRILKQNKVDIVHTRNLAAIEYQVPAFLAGVKCRVHGEHGWDTFDPEGDVKKYQYLRRLLSPLIQVFIPLSGHLQAYLTEKVGVSPHKICRICNGVDITKFYPVNSKTVVAGYPFSQDENSICIGTVGRMHGVKDQITLVTAFVLLMQAHVELKGKVSLLLIGDGPLRAKAIELLEAKQLLKFAWLPGERQDIAELMHMLDIFILPSLSEGISNTILEAMASGLPVIATEVGGNSELVEQNITGLLVPPANAVAMADALYTLIKDKEKRQQLGNMGHQRVMTNFSIQAMVNKYSDLYDSVHDKEKL